MSELPPVRPLDEHNRRLLSNVHPDDWVNPEPAGRYNLVVVGAGTAGLISAAVAAARREARAAFGGSKACLGLRWRPFSHICRS